MTDLAPPEPTRAAPPAAVSAVTPAALLHTALIDSRQRWRDLIDLAADFAFETDEWGRFTLITPDPALDWQASSLVGQPSAVLLADSGDASFNPFRVTARVRHRQAWLKRGDGGIACLTMSATPIRDAGGRITGARGVGLDMTELDSHAARAAMALRRAEMLDHMLRRMGQEVMAARMMNAALDVLASGLGAEGVAVVLAATIAGAARLVHGTGTGADAILTVATQYLATDQPRDPVTLSDAGRPVLIATCLTRLGEKFGLTAWRLPDARAWDAEDRHLIGSAVHPVRMILEREAIERDMTRQARTDPLTGLLNRRAFLEEIERHATRVDREHLPGTVMFADLDNFKSVNDRLGHEAGDDVLRRTASLLRNTFRPTDLIARLGGDEFAIWLNGADHMTAAERAEHLRDTVPVELAEITGPDLPRVTLSIGIASREPDDGEPLDNLMRRADRAMYKVKRGGRGHWRVSLRRRP